MFRSGSPPKSGRVLRTETMSSRNSRCHNSLGLTDWNGTIPSRNRSGWSSHSRKVGEGLETDGGLLAQVVVWVASAMAEEEGDQEQKVLARETLDGPMTSLHRAAGILDQKDRGKH